MVELYIEGTRVGTLADLPEWVAKGVPVECRDAAGNHVGTYTPAPKHPICPWEPSLTKEEMDRRCQQKGVPLSTIFKRLGIE